MPRCQRRASDSEPQIVRVDRKVGRVDHVYRMMVEEAWYVKERMYLRLMWWAKVRKMNEQIHHT